MQNVKPFTFVRIALFLGFLWISTGVSNAQLSPLVDSIPMRDGKKLAADIYIPTGCNSCPTILISTPYNRQLYRVLGLPLGVDMNINNQPYAFVLIDWRGFWGSSAAWTAQPANGEDGYDVIDWIVQQSWSDGKVGTWGPSALGRVQYQTAREQHPNHICAVPLVAAPQYSYEEYYPGGVYRTEYVEQLDALGFGMSTLLLAHPTRDWLWQWSENDTWYPADITIPMLMIGGWYDHNVDVMIDFFQGIQTQSPTAVRDQHRLVMGPWAHGGNGTAQVGTANQGELSFPEAAGWSDSLANEFFDYHLLNDNNGWDQTDAVQAFLMGDNIWEGYASWPPQTSGFQYYLHDGGILDGTTFPGATGTSPIIYDPADPSPTVGGPTLRLDLDQGPYDQAPIVESRIDIATFTSAVEVFPVTFKGSPKVHLFVNSDRKDTDFAVRLTDVYPDGRSMLLSDGIQRMRFRNGYTDADTAVMVPGTIYEIEIELPHQSHTFLPGHQIRLDVTSSNFPRFDRNLNNGGPMYTAGDTIVAHNTLFHNDSQLSYLELPLPLIAEVEELATGSITVFPNPASDFVQIAWEDPAKPATFMQLFSTTGQLLQSKPVVTSTNQMEVDISDLSEGYYIIRLQSTKETITTRLIKF